METLIHPVLGAINSTVTPLREDPEGQVADTIGLMREYVLADYRSPEVGRAAAEAVTLDPDPVAGVFAYVKRRIRFVHDEELAKPWNDPDVVEVLIRPVDMLALGGVAQGDCDDFVMLAVAMYLNLGLDARFVTVAADPRDPSRFSHVYAVVYRAGQRIPIDTSHGEYAGWEVGHDRVYTIREWPVRGIGMLALGLVIGAIYYAAKCYA